MLLEALPYRKDDLLERVHYERFCTEFGFAVCRVDVRGTGSSGGLATDEYPLSELDDMAFLIEWLAGQEWSNGSVGMFGSRGFNSLQVAAARPAALKAIVPIYSSDDRFNDDVHYMGGAMVPSTSSTTPSFMIAMNAMPPVPSLWDGGWREEWRAGSRSNEPWAFTWRSEQRDGAVLAGRFGSTRLRPSHVPHDDRGRMGRWLPHNTFRTVEALENAGTWKLLIGPWSHMGAELSLPGPWIDLTAEMARWFDRWLRDEQNGIDAEPQVTIFHRRSTAPEPDLREVNGT